MAKIERDTVITTALELLDDVGMDGLTMRRLAQALDVQAPSLYWHVANKEVLLDAMADRLVADVARGPDSGEDWRATLRSTAREMRQALRSRRDGARVFAGTYVVTENTLRVAERLIGALRDAGQPPRAASWNAFGVLYYVLGFVMEEQGLQASPDPQPLEARREAFRTLAEGRFPHVLEAMEHVFDLDWDARFEAGLDMLVEGGAPRSSIARNSRAR
jgi:TetR/AcrR family tetracycline transcriptional repressor